MRHKHNNHNSNELIDALAALEAAEERIAELLYQIDNLKIDKAALERYIEKMQNKPSDIFDRERRAELEANLENAQALEGMIWD